VSISFDAGSVNKPIYVTICDGWNELQPGLASSSKLLKTFSLGPAGITLDRAFTVSVSGLADDNGMTLALLQDGKWLSVPTTRVQATGELRGLINRLGILSVMRKSDVEGEVESVPTKFSLEQNYPNPFNPSTTIRYDVPVESKVTLTIYDVLGRKVRTLVDRQLRPGVYEERWNASSLASGAYYYRIDARDVTSGAGRKFSETKRLVLLK
jgi:hypothetical protein